MFFHIWLSREYVIEEPIVSLHPNRPDSGHHQVKANYLFLVFDTYGAGFDDKNPWGN